jgi:hypothetical protein
VTVSNRIDVRVLDMRPHPDQATNNPGCWAVQFSAARAGRSRTFWRWYTVRDETAKKPTAKKILDQFWDNTFAELHGFTFDEDDKG